MDSAKQLSDSNIDALSSDLFPKLTSNVRFLEALQIHLATTRSLQRAIDAVLATFSGVEEEQEKLSFVLYLYDLSGFSADTVVFCFSQPQLAGVASGSIKSEKQLVTSVFGIPFTAEDVPVGCGDAWAQLRRRLFTLEPTAVILGLALSGNFSFPGDQQDIIISILQAATDKLSFNIAKEPIRKFLDSESLKAEVPGLNGDQWPDVQKFFFQIQRLQALVNEPEDISALIKCGYESAENVARSGDGSVEVMVAQGIPQARAEKIRSHANVVAIRNERLWTSALKARSSGGRTDDTIAAVSTVSLELVSSLDKKPDPPSAPEINLTAMFGLESMGCEDCASATSPAAYFVDLLHTLDGIKLKDSGTGREGDSLLVKLKRRRPDLTKLQLSCANTKIPIPYIDLVNEVLESVLWNVTYHLGLLVVPYNMDDDDTCDSVVAQPRHVNYQVYSDIVAKMTAPMNVFPYNQGIDSCRAYLAALGSSRYELLNTLQSPWMATKQFYYSPVSGRQEVVDRYLSAEILGLQSEEYVAICTEGFYSLDFIQEGFPQYDWNQYCLEFRLKTVAQCWGYDDNNIPPDSAHLNQLTLIEDELLPRSGLNFEELIQILKTQYFDGDLVIESAGPINGGPEFTGDLADMRLHYIDPYTQRNNYPDSDIAGSLHAFVRLWKKTQWSLEDFDAIISPLSIICPDTLKALAAVKQIVELSGLSPSELQPLWGYMNVFGPNSLYARLFLNPHIPIPDRKVFERDENGYVLNGNETISGHLPTLTLALSTSEASLKAIISALGLPDSLTWEGLSHIYAALTLCQILGISPLDYGNLLSLYPRSFRPFETAPTTLRLIQEVKSFLSGPDSWTLDQILFVVKGKASLTDSRFQIGVEKAIQVAVSIFSNAKAAGLGSRNANVDTVPETEVVERVHQVAEQVFGAHTGLRVSGFINSSQVKQDNGILQVIEQYLSARIGQENAKQLSNEIEQGNTTLARQTVFLQTLEPLIPKTKQQRIILESLKPQYPDMNSSLLQYSLSDIVEVTVDVSHQLELKSGMDALLLLINNIELAEGKFDGYFLPPTTEVYIISAETGANSPGTLTIDGTDVSFGNAAPWVATTKVLAAGQLYKLSYTGNVKDLKWATQQAVGTPPISFTQEILVPEEVVSNVSDVLLKLSGFSIVSSSLGLEMSEISFWQSSGIFNFNAISLENIRSLQYFSSLKHEFSGAKTTQPLITLYQWLHSPEIGEDTLPVVLSAVTAWPKTRCEQFIHAMYGSPETEPKKAQILDTFKDIYTLFRMRECLQYIDRLGIPNVSIYDLFDMANAHGTVQQWAEFNDASILRLAVDAKLNGLGGTKSVGGAKTALEIANDRIRDNSRNALVHTLLATDYAKRKKLTDADSLFGFFLIDAQMGSELQTTRIKQATSTVQLFIQRCMLGAEKDHGITLADLMKSMERIDWDYMLHYRLWEANRKAFLYPENWIDPTLRDDKSEQFMAIESAISQLKLDSGRIKDLIQGYIHDTNAVANLQVEAYLWDRADKSDFSNYKATLHFFARTRTSPPIYYYRQLDLSGSLPNPIAYWSPWSKMNIDVTIHEADADGKKLPRPGSYMIPAKLNGRLFLFLPEIVLGQQKNNATIKSTETYEQLSKKPVLSSQPDRQWEIRLGFVEYRNGTWSHKTVSQPIICVPPDPAAKADKQLPDISSFKFWLRTRALQPSNTKVIAIVVERLKGIESATPEIHEGAEEFPTTYRQFLGEFQMRGEHIVLVDWNGDLPVATFCAPPAGDSLNEETIPTVFSRVEWPVPRSSLVVYPRNWIDNGEVRQQPDFEVKEPNRDSATVYTWTMSFDNINCAVPTGLVYDIASKQDTQAYFSFPPVHYFPQVESQVLLIEEFSNLISPLLVQSMDAAQDLHPVYQRLSNIPETLYFHAFGQRNSPIFHERSTPFAIYNWELGVHLPSLLIERLIATQQLDLALDVARLVFDPTVDGDKVDRCWSFPPFRDERIRKGKGPDFDNEWKKQMTADEWRASKFSVHAAARGNPVAYMKRIAMKYIEALIAAGDQLFRQDTLESLPMAIQRYTEASHVFGPPPVELPPLGKRAVRTYDDIAKDLDASSNATVDMELEFPFYSEPWSRGDDGDNNKPLGFIRTTYFGIPGNPYLVKLRALIDDRLFKIRNGMDINGNKRTLALWEPPIDPGALQRAMAGGGDSLSSLLAGLDGPVPMYRFDYIIQRAYELVGELKGSAQQLLSIREKKDAEALTALRSQHRRSIIKLTMRIEESERKEVEKMIDALVEQRKLHEMQLRYYLELTGDNKEIPQPGQSWQDIHQVIEAPTKDDFRMSPYEREEITMAEESSEYNRQAGIIETAAAGVFALPTLGTKIQPFGVGVDISFGGANLGQILLCAANALKVTAQQATDRSTQASRRAALTRQLQSRRFEANTLGREIVKLDKDMEQLRVRLATCDARMNLQQQDLENAEAEELWLKNKYTSQQLYVLLETSLASLFHNTYLLASDMVRKAQKALDFEHAMRYPNSTIPQNGGSFLQSSLHGGQFLGEALFLDLKRLEGMHMDNRPHDLEIRKTVSLRQINPWALLQLRESGTADLVLSEALFDMDFPGHYCRRISSVELSIPCVVGPYTSLNCTLKLQSHNYRITPITKDANSYNSEADNGDETTFRTDRIPITSIAVGTGGMHESGTFELGFPAGQRYGPFEGAGAISSWRISLPSKLRPFDYDSISDVLLHIKYTALDGGDALGKIAQDALDIRLEKTKDAPSVVAIDLRSDYADQWRSCIGSGDPDALLNLPNLRSGMLPFWTRGSKIRAESISLLVAANQNPVLNNVIVETAAAGAGDVKLETDEERKVGDFTVLDNKNANKYVTDGWKIKGLGGKSTLTRGWLIIGYYITEWQ